MYNKLFFSFFTDLLMFSCIHRTCPKFNKCKLGTFISMKLKSNALLFIILQFSRQSDIDFYTLNILTWTMTNNYDKIITINASFRPAWRSRICRRRVFFLLYVNKQTGMINNLQIVFRDFTRNVRYYFTLNINRKCKQ